MKLKYITLAIILLVISCTKNDEENNACFLENQSGRCEMNLLNLKVGQKFHYLYYRIEPDDYSTSYDFTYTGDTLELEIIEVKSGKYLMSEKLTDSSNAKVTEADYYSNRNSIFTNYWTIEEGNLVIQINSGKTHFIPSVTLPLYEFTSAEVAVLGWRTTYKGPAEAEVFTSDYKLLGNEYDRLNVYINDKAMIVDAPGYTIFYGPKYGIVRVSVYVDYTRTAIGWDKL